jgi:hypothetical protein
MSDLLEMCDFLDDFIKTKGEFRSVYGLPMSQRTLDKGKEVYAELKNSEGSSYEIIGGSGYTSYALYKSKECIIYVIQVNLNTPTDYVKIDVNNERIFN